MSHPSIKEGLFLVDDKGKMTVVIFPDKESRIKFMAERFWQNWKYVNSIVLKRSEK